MHFHNDFNINRYPNFGFKFSNFLYSKTLGNVIIFERVKIAVENLTWSYNGYENINLKQPSLPKCFLQCRWDVTPLQMLSKS